MFDVEVEGTEYRESEHERAGEDLATATAGELELGLTVCYDLRFPELFRILALRGATAFTVPAAFTAVTGRAHWEILLRARAVENSAFVIAAGQVGKAEPHYESWGHSMLVDPWGRVLGGGRRRRGPCLRRPRSRRAPAGPGVPALAGQPPRRRLPMARGGPGLMARTAAATDRRRQILDAAIRVFAREGYHSCRVSDIADEAGVAYGLVYHYFRSKDEVMNELFTERWSLLLAAIDEVDRGDGSGREKLDAVAGFIIDSYRHDPELMQVIIVEVTRAANSFGRTHLPEINKAYEAIEKIIADAQKAGTFRDRGRSATCLDVLLRRDRAASLGLGLRADPGRRRRFRPCAGDAGRLDVRRPRGAVGPSDRSGCFTPARTGKVRP